MDSRLWLAGAQNKKRIIEKFIRRRSAQTICQGDFLPSEIASIELAEKMKEQS